MTGLAREIGQVFDGFLGVLQVERMGLLVREFDLLLIAGLQLMLDGLDVVDDTAVEEVFEMRQSVEDPESGIVAIGEHVAVTVAVFDGHFADGAIERCVDR